MDFNWITVVTHSYCATCLDAARDSLNTSGASKSLVDDLDTQAQVLEKHSGVPFFLPNHGCDAREENEIPCDCEAHWVWVKGSYVAAWKRNPVLGKDDRWSRDLGQWVIWSK